MREVGARLCRSCQVGESNDGSVDATLTFLIASSFYVLELELLIYGKISIFQESEHVSDPLIKYRVRGKIIRW